MEILFIIGIILFMAQVVGRLAQGGEHKAPPMSPRMPQTSEPPLEQWFEPRSFTFERMEEPEEEDEESFSSMETPGTDLSQVMSTPVKTPIRSTQPIHPTHPQDVEPSSELELDFKAENVLQGIIYSEILGKPKARRRGR